MGLTRQLAELTIGTDSAELPDAAYAAAEKNVLDTLGCLLAGVNAPGIPEVTKLMTDRSGKPEASILPGGTRLPMDAAAFVNSAEAHALDFDQVHKPSALHMMVVLLLACLAAAEYRNCSGRELLAALILGTETACRIGMSYVRRNPRNSYPGFGFLPSSVVGGFGATAAVCRLLGMSVEATTQAFGIFYAQASGNRQALFDKTLTKRLQPAFAARDAIWAAQFAAGGISGPELALEGQAGLFAIYRNSDAPDAEELMEAREYYEIQRGSFKRYPVCGQAMAHAAVELGSKYKFTGNEIQRVQICLAGRTSGLTAGPYRQGKNLQAEVQFCSAYAVALGLLKGRIGLADIREEAIIANRDVAELAVQVEIVPAIQGMPEKLPEDREWSPDGNQWYGVKVITRTGKELLHYVKVKDASGPDSMSREELIAKFRHCCEYAGNIPSARQDAIIDAVKDLRESQDIHTFFNLLCRERS